MKIENVVIVIYTYYYGAMAIGFNLAAMTDLGEIKRSASHIFSILDSDDEYQLQVKENSKMLK